MFDLRVIIPITQMIPVMSFGSQVMYSFVVYNVESTAYAAVPTDFATLGCLPLDWAQKQRSSRLIFFQLVRYTLSEIG